MMQEPETTDIRIPLSTFNRADSVLCSDPNPDWRISKMLKVVRYEEIWEKTTFSRIFEMKGNLEIQLL